MNPFLFFILFSLSQLPLLLFAQKTIQHYIFFNRDRERIQEHSFLNHPHITGAQLKYSWKELEPEKDRYHFEEIQSDLAFLQQHGKRLFIQLQDVSFDKSPPNVPDYLLTDSIYGGGAIQQYITDESDHIKRIDGFVALRWNPHVQQRFRLLLNALAAEFDGQIAGINLPETSVGFGETSILYPPSFTPKAYRDAILFQMKSLREAFSQSIVIQYANFMPGEWLPWDDQGYLESIYEFARSHSIGMGGPDIKIYKKAQMNHSYKFLRQFSEELVSGMAVQWGNYEEINPKTAKLVTVPELYRFAQEEIRVDYIFWCTQEPFYSRDLLTFLKKH